MVRVWPWIPLPSKLVKSAVIVTSSDNTIERGALIKIEVPTTSTSTVAVLSPTDAVTVIVRNDESTLLDKVALATPSASVNALTTCNSPELAANCTATPGCNMLLESKTTADKATCAVPPDPSCKLSAIRRSDPTGSSGATSSASPADVKLTVADCPPVKVAVMLPAPLLEPTSTPIVATPSPLV